MVLTSLPGGTGQVEQPAGMVVQATDPDVTMAYSTPSSASVCYTDLDGSGSYTTGDGVLLKFDGSCSGNSGGSDLAMTSWGTQEAGSRLVSSHRGVPLDSLSPEPRFWYHDVDDSGRPSPGDHVYLIMRQADNGRVGINDIRITPYEDHEAGSRVASGDSDSGRSVSLLGLPGDLVRHVDVYNTNSLMPEDFAYLTADGARLVAGAGDIRIYSADPELPYGQILSYTDPDAKATVTPIQRPLCYVDRDATGQYNPGDRLYLSRTTQCTGNVQSDDIRLNSGPDGEAGSRVASGDEDRGAEYSSLDNARVGYIDTQGSGSLTHDDLVFLNIYSASENRVDPGDILLTPTEEGQGTVVPQDSAHVGISLVDLGAFRDLVVFTPFEASSSPGQDDPVYLSPGANFGQGLMPGDIRLVPVDNLSFGAPVGLETSEVLPSLTQGSASICSSDDNPGTDEQVYLRLDGGCPSNVQSGMLRLKSAAGQQAFTTVRSGDNDAGRGIVQLTGVEFKHSGNSEWGSSNTLYLDIRSTSDDRVDVGDIRLTSFGDFAGGTTVTSSGNDINLPLNSLGSVDQHTGYVDTDRDNEFDTRDYAYITPASSQSYTSPLSVRLTALPAPFVAPEPPETPTETEEPTETETDTETQDETPTTPDETTDTMTDGDGDDVSTPAPAFGAMLLLVVGLTVWMRKKNRRAA